MAEAAAHQRKYRLTGWSTLHFDWMVTGLAAWLGLGAQLAYAEDLFVNDVAREFKAGSTIMSPDSTIGGYAIYQGDNQWRLVSAKATAPNQFGVSYGTVVMVQPEGSEYFIEMMVTANLNQSSRPFFMTADPCSGTHLVKNSKLSSSGGEGSRDNCMTINPHVATVRGKQITTLSVAITNTQSASRYYKMVILLNPTWLGFPGTSVADWNAGSLEANPERKSLVDGMTAWAKQLQSAVSEAIGFSRPKDAFKGVPSWQTFRVTTGVRINESVTLPAPRPAPAPSTTSGGANQAQANISGSQADGPVRQRLAQLQSLLDQGLITKQEFEQKRTEILASK